MKTIKWESRLRSGRGEGYTASGEAHRIEIVGSSPLAIEQGRAQVEACVAAGYFSEAWGRKEPRTDHRVFWPTVEEQDRPELADRAIAMGFNTVVLGQRAWERGKRPLRQDIGSMRERGLRVWVSEDQIESVQEVDAILTYPQTLGVSPTQTRFESLIDLVRQWKERLGATLLIYSLPANAEVADWLGQRLFDLINELPNGVALAFSAVQGSPNDDHLPLHPIWDAVRRSHDLPSIPVLPVVHGCSGGPFLPSRYFDATLLRACGRAYGGALVLESDPSLDYGSLWTAGQMLWEGRCAADLWETWRATRGSSLQACWLQEAYEASADIRLLETDRERAPLCSGRLQWLASLNREEFRPFIATATQQLRRAGVPCSLRG